ncbi:MAG: hypothetical protein M1132_05300 [Chloroflexi bacterium]|nr:hypothetical protein [Chloroflexota bacterium]
MRQFFSKLFHQDDDLAVEPEETGYDYPYSPSWPWGLKLDGHALIAGSPRTGKTTLLTRLAQEAMQQGKAVIAIDMDGVLVPALLTQLPRRRIPDVAWLRVSDPFTIPGFNVLDVSHGEPTNLIVENLVRTAPLLWGDSWVPDLEEALRICVRTLVGANRVLAERNEPQFTLLDIHQLFELPQFCQRLLNQYIGDQEVVRWWRALLERPAAVNRYDWVALLAPLNRFSDSTLGSVLGQSESTLDVSERLQPGRITLIDLRALSWDSKLSAWFGALLADRILRTMLAQAPVKPNGCEPGVVLAIDGDFKLPGLDEPGLLADLRERGASLFWVNQYERSVPANVQDLFLFGMCRYWAQDLVSELGPDFSVGDPCDLRSHEFYLRTMWKNGSRSVNRFVTPVPYKIDYEGTQPIQRGFRPVGQAGPAVKGGREQFYARWFDREVRESLQEAERRRARETTNG